MTGPQPFYEIYLALGLVALLWAVLRVNLAALIEARLQRLVYAQSGAPQFLHILASVCRVMFGVAVFTVSVLCFWPVAGVLLRRRAAE